MPDKMPLSCGLVTLPDILRTITHLSVKRKELQRAQDGMNSQSVKAVCIRGHNAA